MLEVSLLAVETVPRLEGDAWSMVKRLRQATNEHAPSPPIPDLSSSQLTLAEEELELLKGTSLHALTVHWKAQVENDFRELEGVELCGQGGVEASTTVRDALGGNLTEEAYLWALSTVSVCRSVNG